MIKVTKFGAVVLLGALAAAGLASPAVASALTVSANKASHLAREGDTIAVTISGVPAGEGIYVRECVAAATAGTRPSTCVGIANTVWASLDSTSQAQGASAFTGTVNVGVQRTFTAGNGTAVDCEVSTCGILVRRDHLGPTDLSLDTFIPINFAAPFVVNVSKTTAIAFAGESLVVSVTGLTFDQGIYARVCEQPAVAGARPTLCDGQGVWASVSSAMQALGATNADAPITLPAKGMWGSGSSAVDCSNVACGIFVRLDHTDPTNTALDTFVPVTFAAPATVPSPVAKRISSVVNKNQIVFSIVGYKGVSLTFTIGSSIKKVTPTSNGYTYKISLAKGKTEKVKLAQGARTLLDKKFKN